MKLKLGKQKYEINDRVKLNLNKKDSRKISLRSRLLRKFITEVKMVWEKDGIKNSNRLTDFMKKNVRFRMNIIDNSEYVYVIGVNFSGMHCMETHPSNVCYVNGSYGGGLYEVYYNVLVSAWVADDDNPHKKNHVQFRINDMWDTDIYSTVELREERISKILKEEN